jgi:hypothetical protein
LNLERMQQFQNSVILGLMSSAKLCCVVLCHYAMLCDAILLCYAMLCDAILLCYAMLCDAKLCNVVLKKCSSDAMWLPKEQTDMLSSTSTTLVWL